MQCLRAPTSFTHLLLSAAFRIVRLRRAYRVLPDYAQHQNSPNGDGDDQSANCCRQQLAWRRLGLFQMIRPVLQNLCPYTSPLNDKNYQGRPDSQAHHQSYVSIRPHQRNGQKRENYDREKCNSET